MTIIEAIRWANNKLKKQRESEGYTGAQADSFMLDAEIMLANVLGVQKSWLFTHFNDELKEHESEKFRQMVARRMAHEPVAYIIGKKAFYKRDFAVNRFALIPRPSTETLIEKALETVKNDDTDTTLFVDIGTGSGAVAVTLAVESKLNIIATDISSQAITLAKQNAEKHGVAEKIDFRSGDLLEPIVKIFRKLTKTDSQPFSRLVICANLPYLTESQFEKTQPEIQLYEPRNALVAGPDGLDEYWRLFRSLSRQRSVFPRKLSMIIEIDPSQSEAILDLIRHNFPFAKPEIFKDLEDRDRIVMAEL